MILNIWSKIHCFSENAWVKSAVNRDSDTPNYRFWADHMHMILLSKKSNLLNVRWRTTVQFKELSLILHDFEDLVKHSRFFRKRFGSEGAVNQDSDTPNYPFWADHIHMIRLWKKSNLLNVWWRTTVQSKELSLILPWCWRFGQTFTGF